MQANPLNAKKASISSLPVFYHLSLFSLPLTRKSAWLNGVHGAGLLLEACCCWASVSAPAVYQHELKAAELP